MAKERLHLFIDTNAFLNFFAYTRDDVEELKKLVSLIKTKQLKLYLTEQVRDEFYRNREKKLHDSIAQFDKSVTPHGVPRFMADYPQIADYLKAEKKLVKARDEAVQRAKKEAESGRLGADALFRQLVAVGRVRKMRREDFAAATRRMRRGNPPGKENSLGDRINWEILLRTVDDGTDLHIVSRDGDFASPLNSALANGFLVGEWKQRKQASLFIHTELKPCLAKHFPNIKFAVDVEKRAAIDRLKDSASFAATHSAIAALEPFADVLTTDEIEELLEVAQKNSQIAWIASDEDVKQFYQPLLQAQHDNRRLSKTDYKRWRKHFGLELPSSKDRAEE